MKIVRVSGVTSDPILHSKILLFHPVRLTHFLAETRKGFLVSGVPLLLPDVAVSAWPHPCLPFLVVPILLFFLG